MATTITHPVPYSSIKYPVVFGVDRPLDAPCEVKINGYTKLLTNDARSINVAQYFREEFDVVPNTAQVEPLKVYDAIEHQRIVEAFIVADGVRSTTVPLIAANTPLPTDRILSDLRRRIVARGDIDEITVHLAAAADIVCGENRIALTAGLSIVGFKVDLSASDRFSVHIVRNTEIIDTIHYETLPDAGVRLAWINTYGAIDYWNFDIRRKASTKITKEKMYAASGYIPTAIKAEVTQTVATQPQAEHTTATLSQIFVADRVWVITGGKAHGVDVTNETTILYDDDQLSALQVDYRTNIRKL